MDMSPEGMIASFAVSTIGFGSFIYGKKQLRFPQLGVGIALMALPMVTASPIATWGVGVGLVLGLFVMVRLGL